MLLFQSATALTLVPLARVRPMHNTHLTMSMPEVKTYYTEPFAPNPQLVDIFARALPGRKPQTQDRRLSRYAHVKGPSRR